jgi:ligand-binding SRPBCC domain-containing protein
MVLPRKINDVFSFFSNAKNLERITPPELRFRITTPTPITMREGTVIDYNLKLWGVPFAWKARICRWQPPFQFIDEQIQGPYRLWIHKHRFMDLDGKTRVTDEVTYALPLWPLGEAVFPFVHFLLMKIFRYRERAIRALFQENIP